MIDLCKQAFRNLALVIWNGLACLAVIQAGLFFFDRTVLFMRPVEASWCASDDYVQAAFIGIKMRDRWPVPGSFSGQASFGTGMPSDVLFTFPGDPTPDSSRPAGFGGFGVWRWYTAIPPESVSMSMRHEDADGVHPITFGPFDVPGDIQPCEVNR